MKKARLICTAIAALTFAAAAAGCAGDGSVKEANFNPQNKITAMNRELGSGTKISFLELIERSEEDIVMNKDNMSSGTAVMLAAIASDVHGIGYVSLGAVDDTVKPVSINNIVPSKENIQNGSYPMVRNFSLVTDAETTDAAQDFIKFVTDRGTAVIEGEGYIAVNPSKDFQSERPKGEITIAGSTSVLPLMEKLMEEYKIENPDAVIEVNETDSTGGIKAVTEGISQIAMVSRELSEKEESLVREYVLAKDGIAIIVNKNNPINNLTMEALQDIYTGHLSVWQDCPVQ